MTYILYCDVGVTDVSITPKTRSAASARPEVTAPEVSSIQAEDIFIC